VAEVEGKPGGWVRRQLVPTKKVEDHEPRSLGPCGTWVYKSPGEEVDSTQTPVQQDSTVTALQ